MINFCKNRFNSIVGFPSSDDRRHAIRWRHFLPPPARDGLHLLTADFRRPSNVVESHTVVPAIGGGKKADPGVWGLHEAGAAGGIDLCTEGLGSESCDAGIEIGHGDGMGVDIERRATRRPSRMKKAETRFPPPLTWMTGPGGRRCRCMKADRRDGRFVLTELRIDPQPELLRAFRENGRLRLEFVGLKAERDGESEAIRVQDEEEAENTAESEEITEEEETSEISDEERSEEISIEGKSEENEERWKLPRVRNEGQRCVDMVSSDVSAALWWSHRFIPTA